MSEDVLAQLLDQLVERIADRVVQKLQGGAGSGYVDQSTSPIGPRRHIDAIRSGKLRGVQVGRRYVARVADVEAYVRDSSVELASSEPADEVDALAEELGLRKTTKGG